MQKTEWQTKLPKESIEAGYYFRKRKFESLGNTFVIVIDIALVWGKEDLRIEKDNVIAWSGPIPYPEVDKDEKVSLRPVAHTETPGSES